MMPSWLEDAILNGVWLYNLEAFYMDEFHIEHFMPIDQKNEDASTEEHQKASQKLTLAFTNSYI